MINGKLWKQVGMTYFEEPSWHLPGNNVSGKAEI
jgi:hypothetical protein